MHDLIETLQQLSTLFSKLILGIGTLVIFYYCAYVINFFPTGLSISDSLIFIFLALAFGIAYLLWILLGYTTVYLLFYPFSSRLGKSAPFPDKAFTFLVGFVLLLFTCLFWYLTGDFRSTFAPLAGGYIILVVIVYWKDTESTLTTLGKKFDPKIKFGVIFFALIMSGFIGHKVVHRFINTSFSLFSISQDLTSVAIEAKNERILRQVSAEFHTPIYSCDSNHRNIAHNIKILWHGIGEKSVIEVLSKTDKNKWNSITRVELDRKGLHPVKNLLRDKSKDTCISLKTNILFDSFSDQPNDLGLSELSEFKSTLKKHIDDLDFNLHSITITGHSDINNISLINDSNYRLLSRRAENIKTKFKSYIELNPDTKLEIKALGDFDKKTNCPDKLTSHLLKKCFSSDRAIEIRVYLKKKPLKTESDDDKTN